MPESILFSHYVYCSCMRHFSYLNSATFLVSQYQGTEPFSLYIKKYFSTHKKFGSKDRKQITHLCYCYFRMGKMLEDVATEEKIIAGLFLSSVVPNEMLQALRPGWNEKARLSLYEKLDIINLSFSADLPDLFPWTEHLSDGINALEFAASFFIQPDLFLRTRPGRHAFVQNVLKEAGVEFRQIGEDCLSLANATKVDRLITLNTDAVVQDYNSQQTAKLVEPILNPATPINVWDACAASGGKSIMIHDLNPEATLTISDIRPTIITNLKTRFRDAGIKNYIGFVADLSQPITSPPLSPYDLVIADVPCTGSGTWSRTPEQLYFFNGKKIREYSALQKKIMPNVLRHLKPGGYLLYITCSVFKEENEEIISFLKQNFHLDLLRVEVLKGYHIKADTMFAALLRIPL